MISSYWLTLPESWDIENVRAVLAFLINLVCAGGVWVFAWTIWKDEGAQLNRDPQAKAVSLLSLWGLGHVVDTIPYVRRAAGSRLLSASGLQCAVVCVLSVTAIISGPIARYSTRTEIVARQADTSGWLATTDHGSIEDALVQWNVTIERLKSASFPLDQLLDFVPDNAVNWVYRRSEWNSSWSAFCRWTGNTTVKLSATGNNTGDIFDAIPGLQSVLPLQNYASPYNHTWGGRIAYRGGDTIPEALVFTHTQNDPSIAFDKNTNTTSNYYPLNLTIAAFHLHNPPLALSSNGSVDYGVGEIERSSYTMASCQLSRTGNHDPSLDGEDTDIAFIWTQDIRTIITGLSQFYSALLMERSITGQSILLPSGQDLFRFYQVYMATKDTQYQHAVSRSLSVAIPAAELALPALVIFLLYVVILLMVLVRHGVPRRLPEDDKRLSSDAVPQSEPRSPGVQEKQTSAAGGKQAVIESYLNSPTASDQRPSTR